jgi:teichuronic acid biosynthesis protein TuaE
VKTISIKSFTYGLIITCLFGANIIFINLGFFKLSPFRILILLSIFFITPSINKILRNKNKELNFSYVFFLFFWLIYSIISLFWVKDIMGWTKVISFFIPGFLSTIFIFANFKTKFDIIKCIEIIVWVSIFYSFLAFYEIFTGNYLFLFDDNLEFYKETVLLTSATGIRPPVTVFGNPNDYSLFLYFSIVFALILYKIKDSKFHKFLYLAFILAAIFLIICTQSRSSFIGIAIFFITYAFFSFIRKSAVYKSVCIFLMIVFSFFLYFILQDYIWIFTDVTSFDFQGTGDGGSDDIRISLIKNGLIYLFRSGFLGVGLGNIEYYMKSFSIYNTEGIENMHNWWLEILVSSGIIIFISYIIIYFNEMRKIFLSYRKFSGIKQKNIYGIFFCFFIGFIVSCVGSSSLITSEWIWPLLAICMKISSINFENDNQV